MRTRLVGVAIVGLVIMLVGCAPMLFQKAGATEADLNLDRYQCEIQENSNPFAQAYARDPLGNMAYPAIARRNISNCLELKGWKRLDG